MLDVFSTLLAAAVALCIGIEIGITLRRQHRHHSYAAQDLLVCIEGAVLRHHYTHCRGNSIMYTKGSILLLAIVAVMADRTTPGALQAGTGITLTPDNPNLGTLTQLDATNYKYEFTDFGTVNFHATGINSDGEAIVSSQDASATATDQAATDIVISITAAPVAPPDTGGGT